MDLLNNVVHVNIVVEGSSRASTDDLSTICFLCTNDSLPRTSRYPSLLEVLDDWTEDDNAYLFAQDVFTQSLHPDQVVIAVRRSTEDWGDALKKVLGIIPDDQP